MQQRRSRTGLVMVSAVVLATAVAVMATRSQAPGDRELLTVYCAHDSQFAEPVLREFERRTGIPLRIRYDTEATKSLGLVNLLIAEKDEPRCDVFWNNQVLGTVQLQQHDLLVPYKGDGYGRIPKSFKDPDGRWVGFGARLRVFIINTDTINPTEQALQQALQGDLSRMAVAKPLFGTTLSHYCVLWHEWGGERVRQWHREMRDRGVKEVSGNATAKNLVAEGVCDFAWTDTDDYFVAQDEGRPVAMLPVRLESRATICIPNSAAIIRGTNRLAEAQQLIDYLASAETEIALARSPARQIPLGPVPDGEVPEDVRQLRTWAEEGYDLTPLGPARIACLEWLESEYLQ